MNCYIKHILSLFSALLLLICLYSQVSLGQQDHKKIGNVPLENNQEKTITQTNNAKKHHVLIITSQPYVTEWFSILNAAFRGRISALMSPETKISYEYIGSDAISDPEFVTTLIKLLRMKYARVKPDLVVGIMPTSSGFLLQHGEEVFPDVPKVYALPESAQIKQILAQPGVGIVEGVSDIRANIERISRFFPETKHLVVVSGMGADDLVYVAKTQQAIKDVNWPGTVTYLAGIPANELTENLSHLPAHSAVLMLTYLRDKNGKYLTTVEVMDAVIKRANAPIFSFYDTVFGHGIVGGKLSSADSYGETIAAAVHALIHAGDQKVQQVKITAELHDIYDWRQLKKWNVPVSILPEGSIIRYRTPSFWEENLKMIILVLMVFLVQGALIVFFIINIIKGRRLTIELKDSEQKLAAIIDFLPDATFAIDREGSIIAWNRAIEEMTGFPAVEMIGKGNYEYALPFFEKRQPILIDFVYTWNEEVAKNYLFIKKNGDTLVAESNICVIKGKKLALSGMAGPLYDSKGNTVGAIESIRDITERKQLEQELIEHREQLESMVRKRTAELMDTNDRLKIEIEDRIRIEKMLIQSEAKYRNLVESANSIIMRWLTDGRIAFFNRYAQDFFGYGEQEIIGKNILDTIVPPKESTGRDLSSLAQDIALNPGAYVRNVNENIRKNGERVWVAWANKPIFDETGKVVEILSVGNDITKLIETEKELRNAFEELGIAKEHAEAADKIKSAFLATMSHELRTPLNSIIGFTGIILRERVGPLNDEQKKQLNMVRDSAQHLLSLINDVLDISKIEAGQLQVAYENFDMRHTIEKAVEIARPLAVKKGLGLTCAISPEIGTITGDRRRVEQILLNLISNAIKFTEKGSVEIKCESEGNNVTTRVIDTGIGIKTEDMETIFQAFQQIDSGITRKYEGTGLGLSICKKLVELMGGKIWVSSVWGSGSTFSFSLPKERKNV